MRKSRRSPKQKAQALASLQLARLANQKKRELQHAPPCSPPPPTDTPRQENSSQNIQKKAIKNKGVGLGKRPRSAKQKAQLANLQQYHRAKRTKNKPEASSGSPDREAQVKGESSGSNFLHVAENASLKTE
ncbi:hypothetical protein BOTBODRAFT_583464 [Botryobasidium botryosum FD-172 SS1]|uniref:Uncharacterized protein n=1 Tax=Botryobasidium botryosum (strain FD-172 SS1) TaxID=930990 RepID=A0A067N215_BOTB1|nr:hypothetical protein BOTBODRAFT_583464 [Botryobasidium botryosum FD-172 SS1]